jgi:hypothetical protein
MGNQTAGKIVKTKDEKRMDQGENGCAGLERYGMLGQHTYCH